MIYPIYRVFVRYKNHTGCCVTYNWISLNRGELHPLSTTIYVNNNRIYGQGILTLAKTYFLDSFDGNFLTRLVLPVTNSRAPFTNSSLIIKSKAEAKTLCTIFVPIPLYMPFRPSCCTIFVNASNVPESKSWCIKISSSRSPIAINLH